MSDALAWLHAQGVAMVATVGDVWTNHPEPARQVIGSAAMIIALIWAALKIVKKVSK
jgi:hypothetical protein